MKVKVPKQIKKAAMRADLRAGLRDMNEALKVFSDGDPQLARLALLDEDDRRVRRMLKLHTGEIEWVLGYLRGAGDALGVKASTLVK